MKIAILYFQDIKRPLAGDLTYLSNLSRGLIERGHEVEILSWFSTQSDQSLWRARFKRNVYAAYVLAKSARLSRFDLVLFAEPLYPFNMLLLRYLKSRIKSHIILCEVGAPVIRSRLYYLPIRNRFPVFINGDNARHFAESISTDIGLAPEYRHCQIPPFGHGQEMGLVIFRAPLQRKGSASSNERHEMA